MEPRFGPMTGNDISALLVIVLLFTGPVGWLLMPLVLLGGAKPKPLSGAAKKAERQSQRVVMLFWGPPGWLILALWGLVIGLRHLFMLLRPLSLQAGH
jgi:hypothetical protein